jgi:hypothetical protein
MRISFGMWAQPSASEEQIVGLGGTPTRQVQRDGLHLGVGIERVGTQFTAQRALLVTAERQLAVDLMSVVDPDNAGLHALCDGQRTGVVGAQRAQLEIFLWHLGTFNYSCRRRRRTLPRAG